MDEMTEALAQMIDGAIDACAGSGELLDGAMRLPASGGIALVCSSGRAYLVSVQPAHFVVTPAEE